MLHQGPTSRKGIIPSDWGGERGFVEEEVGQRWKAIVVVESSVLKEGLTVLKEGISGAGSLRLGTES